MNRSVLIHRRCKIQSHAIGAKLNCDSRCRTGHPTLHDGERKLTAGQELRWLTAHRSQGWLCQDLKYLFLFERLDSRSKIRLPYIKEEVQHVARRHRLI